MAAFDPITSPGLVDVDGSTADGPFSLTIAVDKARTSVLEGVAR